MADKTTLHVPGRKLLVPKALKRTVQASTALLLTAAIALAVVVANGLLLSRGTAWQAMNTWLLFVKRTDIQATAVLTAFVTVMFVYWQRDRERR